MAVKAVKKTAPKAAEASAAPQQPKGKSKLKIILLILLLVGGGGGGAYWYFSQPSGPAATAKPDVAKPPVFQPLDNFTVNLQVEENAQFLQTGITLRVVDKAAVELIKQRMPEIRNAVLLLLSARKPSEILTVEGKRKLSSDIVIAINSIFDPAAAKATSAKPPATPAAADAPATEPASAPAAAASDPATAPETTPETGEDSAAPSETKSPGPVLEVLFTIFIVQ